MPYRVWVTKPSLSSEKEGRRNDKGYLVGDEDISRRKTKKKEEDVLKSRTEKGGDSPYEREKS